MLKDYIAHCSFQDKRCDRHAIRRNECIMSHDILAYYTYIRAIIQDIMMQE